MCTHAAGLALLVLLGVADAAAARSVRLRYAMRVPAHAERTTCQWLTLADGHADDAVLVGWSLRAVGETHHAAVFDATGVAPVDAAVHDGLASECAAPGLPFLVTALTAPSALRFPPGIAIPWHRPQAVVVEFHAVNTHARPRWARIRVRFAFRPPQAADRLAVVWVVASTTDWSLPVGQTGVLGGDVRYGPVGPLTVVTLQGHMHARGRGLVATLDGQPIYQSDDWRHPPARVYAPPWNVTGQLAVACLYDNGVTRPVRRCDGVPCALPWGSSADDAMCQISGYAVAP